MAKSPEKAVLERIRLVCLDWPETNEVLAWGHPNFKAGKQTFAVLEIYKGVLSLAMKMSPERKRRLSRDARFYETPYIGNQGWLSLKVDQAVLKNWEEVGELLLEAYKCVALKRMLKALGEA